MLYVVATPIGNLEDITLRALRILGEVDLIVCEDTRITGKLLSHYHIKTPMLSWHANSSSNKLDEVIEIIKNGQDVALVSDAGTPTISDPGVLLIAKLRSELPETVISPIPGPSALIAALSVAGISSTNFMWLGFLPHKKGRTTLFNKIADSEVPVVFYESPHRIVKTLESLHEVIPKRKIILGRELTKIYEEIVADTASGHLNNISSGKQSIKGEFVVIID